MKFITIVYMYYSYKMFQNTAFCQAQMGKFCSLQNKFFFNVLSVTLLFVVNGFYTFIMNKL